jgi:hypothetical protein
MMAALRIVNIVLLAVCREQGPVKKYSSGVIEETLLVSGWTRSCGKQALTLV